VGHKKWSLAEKFAEPVARFNSEHIDLISHHHFIIGSRLFGD
jgi:hypothetical protein